MTVSKARFAFRPLVENLESRLQPGSIITGTGFGWSFLADLLLNLDRGRLDSQSVVSQASSDSDRLALRSILVGVHSDQRDIAVASLLTARSETASLPPSNRSEERRVG